MYFLFGRAGVDLDIDIAGVCGGEEDGVKHGGYEADTPKKIQHEVFI
jgi:hypothetical protein